MTIADRMRQRQIKDKKAKAARRTCSMCGIDKPKENYSGRNSHCNSCSANKIVTCGCGRKQHKRLKEKDMKIYDVANDKYFLTQKCADIHWGIQRGVDGWVK